VGVRAENFGSIYAKTPTIKNPLCKYLMQKVVYAFQTAKKVLVWHTIQLQALIRLEKSTTINYLH